jgi:hypothetical protein
MHAKDPLEAHLRDELGQFESTKARPVQAAVASALSFTMGGLVPFAGAFAPFGTIAGCAGALYSFIQLGGGVIIGWLSSFFLTKNPYSLSIVFIFTSIAAWIIFELIVMKTRETDEI